MTSRRTLWALLAMIAVYPVLEATMGCSFQPGTAPMQTGPIEDNAVECDCSFPDEPGSRTLRVQASADDAEQDGVNMDLTNGDLDLAQKHVGLRFAAVGLPAEATIESAYVQFTADESQGQATTLTIQAQGSVDAPAFTNTDADVTLRTPGAAAPVAWTVDPWTNNAAGAAERTPELKTLIQELVGLSDWTEMSPVVLRFSGAGHRTAESFDGNAAEAPQLVVSYTTTIGTTVPTCASDATAADRDANGHLTQTKMVDVCNDLATTFGGLNEACGLPAAPVCTPVDRKDPNGGEIADSFERAVCETPCTEMPLDESDGTCSNYDPVAFVNCLQANMSFEECKSKHVSATHTGSDDPICVASGSALAFHAFGRRTLCELDGISAIEVGDREPKKDPKTNGTVELVGGPCPGGDCYIHPFFLLSMEPITFDVRWASDPTFGDLGAAAGGLETALLDDGQSSFASETVEGTGRGRRGSDGLSIAAMNPDPLDLGVDWTFRTCLVDGALAVGVADDGVCEVDGTTPCRGDADCAGVGGVCVLPPDDDAMSVDLGGDAQGIGGLVRNMPPTAVAGASQTVECTSSAGASFVLNGRGSSDPEPNLALASWRVGTRAGTEISNDLVTEQALGVGGSQSYVLRVIDALGQLDEDTTMISVVDTTPPEIACNAPATVKPPNAEQGLAFAATATDTCDDEVAAGVVGYDCFTFTKKGKRVSKLESCIVSFADDTLTIHDVGGYGDIVQWTVAAIDDSGNVGEKTCEVLVTK